MIKRELLKKEIEKHKPGEEITFNKFNLPKEELYRQLADAKLLDQMRVSFIGNYHHLEEIKYVKLPKEYDKL